ncbi:hypothetical protein [Leptospira ilyithenensis]|uniref:Lipoprotein n=1 Tax=Leptospira ilyithenensis TaxID=2484901 RepID=A0A4R9LVZ9_9LEPT|nr:hypothetical protein [Leptospira ilyithenensis]TGN14107.1 hypothetical protein EHS11_02750 [Leptospira ilyithenensis]
MKNRILAGILLVLVSCSGGNLKEKEKPAPVATKQEQPQLTIKDFEGSWYEEDNLDQEMADPHKYDYAEGYVSSSSLGKFKIWQDSKRGLQLEIHLALQADSYFPRSRYEIIGKDEARIFYTIPNEKEEIVAIHIRKLKNNKTCILSLLEESKNNSYASYKCKILFTKPVPDPFPGDWNSARHKKNYYTLTYGEVGVTNEFDKEALDAGK